MAGAIQYEPSYTIDDNNGGVLRRDVLRKGAATGTLLAAGGIAASGTAAAHDMSASLEFSSDCKEVEVTIDGHEGEFTLEIVLMNGNTKIRTGDADGPQRFSFDGAILADRVKVDGDVIGGGICSIDASTGSGEADDVFDVGDESWQAQMRYGSNGLESPWGVGIGPDGDLDTGDTGWFEGFGSPPNRQTPRIHIDVD